MLHPVYKLPLRFVLRLRLQKGGGVFAGHYGIILNTNQTTKTRPGKEAIYVHTYVHPTIHTYIPTCIHTYTYINHAQ